VDVVCCSHWRALAESILLLSSGYCNLLHQLMRGKNTSRLDPQGELPDDTDNSLLSCSASDYELGAPSPSYSDANIRMRDIVLSSGALHVLLLILHKRPAGQITSSCAYALLHIFPVPTPHTTLLSSLLCMIVKVSKSY
jgi:hypothetical protein